jgi:mono/diheme cytochrome c family protein
MAFCRMIFMVFLFGLLLGFIRSGNGAEQSGGPGFPDAPGKDVLLSRCFQCHNERMWKDLKQERRGWEGVLYRMVGRGALWTEEEINSMATYLANAFGPQAAEAPK